MDAETGNSSSQWMAFSNCSARSPAIQAQLQGHSLTLDTSDGLIADLVLISVLRGLIHVIMPSEGGW